MFINSIMVPKKDFISVYVTRWCLICSVLSCITRDWKFYITFYNLHKCVYQHQLLYFSENFNVLWFFGAIHGFILNDIAALTSGYKCKSQKAKLNGVLFSVLEIIVSPNKNTQKVPPCNVLAFIGFSNM